MVILKLKINKCDLSLALRAEFINLEKCINNENYYNVTLNIIDWVIIDEVKVI